MSIINGPVVLIFLVLVFVIAGAVLLHISEDDDNE